MDDVTTWRAVADNLAEALRDHLMGLVACGFTVQGHAEALAAYDALVGALMIDQHDDVWPPVVPGAGDIYRDTSTWISYRFDGIAWEPLAPIDGLNEDSRRDARGGP
jgi:hypothetical protein